MCQAVLPQISLTKNILFNSSGVTISLPHSHSMCNTSTWSSYDVLYEAVFSRPSLAKACYLTTYMLAHSLCVAHSHSFCITSIWPFCDAMCQVVFSSPSLAKNEVLFNSSPVSTSFAQSHNLFNIASWPFSADTSQAVCLT